MRRILKPLAAVILALLAYIAVGGAMVAVAGALPMRGEMVDIGGGRRMHIVCDGPKTAAPTILFEAGAFGFSADWGAVQPKVVARGLHACAYDRAGLGFSDPGPAPRDANAVVSDLERLLKAAHEDGPFILVGHSMAGLYLPLFAARNPDKIAGLVFVDTATPQVSETPSGRQFADAFAKASRLAALGARLGLFTPLQGTWLGDKYGLPPAASAEKRRAFASPAHNRWASAEVDQWMASAAEAKAAGPLNPAWPVAVITAGKHRADLSGLVYAPARASRAGYSENAPNATHQTLVGLAYSDAVVRGIDRVRDAVAKSAT
jgi:pimeloyl-ACP methyl ester carboxylesterase